MAGKYSSKCCCVYDLSLFIELAPVLARDFGRVLLYIPGQESAFPKSSIDAVGRGLPGVERVTSWVDHIDEVDLWVFTDCWSGDVQTYLADVLHKRVWGSRNAELIEQLRLVAKRRFKQLGIPVGPYSVVKGFDALHDYISDHKDVYVKLSGNEHSNQRGDFETFHAENVFVAEQRLRDLQYKLGARADRMELICEDAIPDAVEICYDGYSVDGQYPGYAPYGVEAKSEAYVGKWCKYEKLPKQIQDSNERIAGDLKSAQCRSWFGIEMRVTKDGNYVAEDPLARFGSPMGELCFEWVTNLAEVLWEGAGGVCVDPKPKSLYGAELLIHSEYASDNWSPIQFPAKHRDHIKFRNMTILDGKFYTVPQTVGVSQVCAVIGMQGTLEAAVEEVKEIAAQVVGYKVDTSTAGLDAAVGTWGKLKDHGVL